MKPILSIRKPILERQELFSVLSEARTAMIQAAHRRARNGHATATEIRLAEADADRQALMMSQRVMRVSTFDDAMAIVKEYVDVNIV